MAEDCVLGLDPGISGAVAFYFPSAAEMIAAEDLPVAGGMVAASALARRVEQMRPTLAIVELVGSMPKQGVSSTFKFGTAFGIAIGVLGALAIPVRFVTPGKWKRHFALPSDKEAARARALQTWPGRAELFARKKDHGRAEAALLARYGAEVLLSGVGE